MRKISPQQFWSALVEVLHQYQGKVVAIWKSPTEYTRFIRTDIVPELSKRLELQVYPTDYYTLDAIYYEEADRVHFPSQSTYAKWISIALEHENVLKGSCVEMNKLQLFNTPLKVLITYARPGRESKEYLDKYTDIIRSADIWGDIASQRRQLVVFGDMPELAPKWYGHAYEQNGFVQIGEA